MLKEADRHRILTAFKVFVQISIALWCTFSFSAPPVVAIRHPSPRRLEVHGSGKARVEVC